MTRLNTDIQHVTGGETAKEEGASGIVNSSEHAKTELWNPLKQTPEMAQKGHQT